MTPGARSNGVASNLGQPPTGICKSKCRARLTESGHPRFQRFDQRSEPVVDSASGDAPSGPVTQKIARLDKAGHLLDHLSQAHSRAELPACDLGEPFSGRIHALHRREEPRTDMPQLIIRISAQAGCDGPEHRSDFFRAPSG